MSTPTLPNDTIISEKARRVAAKALDKIEDMLNADAVNPEKLDALANAASAASLLIEEEEKDSER